MIVPIDNRELAVALRVAGSPYHPPVVVDVAATLRGRAMQRRRTHDERKEIR